jgi:hypothetical protein
MAATCNDNAYTVEGLQDVVDICSHLLFLDFVSICMMGDYGGVPSYKAQPLAGEDHHHTGRSSLHTIGSTTIGVG